jgi:peptidoglycan/LPS O-acetylase OafA/YrhL
MASKLGFRGDINGLRAFSVLSVLFFHFGINGFEGGFVGVDAFFVISGYLMTGIILSKVIGKRFSFLEFYLARAVRIIPPLVFLCLALLVFGLFFLPPTVYKTLAIHVASSITFLSNFSYYQEAGYFDAASQQKWLLHTWSLSVEWQFYMLYPVIISLLWRVCNSERKLYWCLFLMVCISLALSIIFSGSKPRVAFFLLPTRAWEMMFGGLVYMLKSKEINIKYPSSAIMVEILGFILFFVAVFTFKDGQAWPSYTALIPVLGISLIIFANRNDSILTNSKYFQYIGKISYSLYLWHWPVIVFITFFEIKRSASVITIGVLTSVLFGALSYHYVESLMGRRLGGKAFNWQWATVLCGVATVGVISSIVFYSNGVQTRINSPEYFELSAAETDWQYPDKYCVSTQSGGKQCNLKSHFNINKRVVFIGDSHAEQWYPRYSHMVNKNDKYLPNMVFFTKGGCIPIRGIDNIKPGYNCEKFSASVWDYLSNTNVDTVIITARWTSYLYDKDGYLDAHICFDSGNGCNEYINTENKLDKVYEKLEYDLNKIVRKGAKVYIVGSTAEPFENYADRKGKLIAGQHLPMLGFLYRINQDDFFVADMKGRADSVKRLRELSNRIGSTFIDPVEYMCVKGRCDYLSASRRSVIFKDDNHLRASVVINEQFSWLDQAVLGGL